MSFILPQISYFRAIKVQFELPQWLFGYPNLKNMRAIIIYFLLLFLTSCSCDQQYLCPPLSDSGIEWINNMHSYGDTIEYRSSLGETFEFHLKSKEISPSSLEEGCYRSGLRCYCNLECNVYGNLEYEPDSTNPKLLLYRYWIDERFYNGVLSSKYYSFTIFDLRRTISNQFSESATDSFYTSLTIDTISYNNVYVFAVDTTLEYYTDRKVWKSYITLEEGIIAFWERPSNSLFIRQ